MIFLSANGLIAIFAVSNYKELLINRSYYLNLIVMGLFENIGGGLGSVIDIVLSEVLDNDGANYGRRNSAPPPPPGHHKTIRVIVAVNGHQYGPYDESGLMNMIRNGSLNKNTYVFLEGDSMWRLAKDVYQVNRLFGGPAVPPPPGGSNMSSAIGADGLSVKMNSLIDAAVADGEITDLERQVLIRNAQAENVPIDELVMILEARLYEQRKKLKAEYEAQNNRRKQAVPPVRVAPPPPLVMAKKSDVRKCPACGEIIFELSATVCKQCGYEFDKNSNVPNPGNNASSPQTIHEILRRIDQDEVNFANRPFKKNGERTPDFDGQRNRAIVSFPVPQKKPEFIDLLILCANNAKDDNSYQQEAWTIKRNELLDRAGIMFKCDDEIDALVEKYTPKKKKFGIF